MQAWQHSGLPPPNHAAFIPGNACRYTSRGFGLSYISHFTGMPTGDVVAHIVEGRTAKISVVRRLAGSSIRRSI